MTMPKSNPLRIWATLNLLAAGLACGAAARAGVVADGDTEIHFARDIRPILADKCFACHGPDEDTREGKLRLDRQEDARRARDGGAAIVPGDPDESLLVFRVESEEADLRMPPASSGKSLSEREIALLREWVRRGGEYTPHWAFVPPVRHTPPTVRKPDWVRNPIDAFVLARLERAGIEPSPEADRVTLARRLSLDLVGLPPSIEQIDRFVIDPAPDAYEQYVERLLASPHYGERWGRVWLDAARYADSDGYEKDKPRFVWNYRDWVVRALNRDMPYDRFLVEQLAGDLLPGATQDQRVATGFLRNSMINEEGGIDPEQFRMEAMFDRMDAIGTAILGLTLRCAQCHSHKYDPLTHDEYYQMFAFLNDCDEATIAVYSPEQESRREVIFAEIGRLEAELRAGAPDWAERMAAWEARVRGDQPAWHVVTPEVDDDSTGGQKYLLQADGSFLAQGYAPTKHTVKLTARVHAPRITAFRLELLNDPNLPMGGPGRSIKGTGALTEFVVEAAPADQPDKSERVRFSCATADVAPPEAPLESTFDDKSGKKRVTGPIRFAIDGNDLTAWGFDTGPAERNRPRKAVFVAETPIESPGGTILTFKLAQNHGGWNSDDNQNCNLGRFRLSITDREHPTADPLPARVREIVERPPGAGRTSHENDLVFSHWRATVPEWRAVNQRIEALLKDHPEPTTQLALARRASGRATSVLERGDFLKPKRAVEPRTPGWLNPFPAGAPVDRLGFARWITDRAAPTTARALVNRVWQSYFGTGLVETPEDFGTQGALPSHPELLDWLAVEFMEGGWSFKSLHRLIVRSNTYRQGSKVGGESAARDPANRLLSRGARFRVDAEVVRDVALAASGLLDPRVGGPPVQPPAPEFLFVPPASYGPKVWNDAPPPDRYRRALYTFRFRSVPYPALQTFDAPNGDIACARRPRSNTPLQALTTLNEPLFMECARALAFTVLRHSGDDPERLIYAFRRCVGRAPEAREVETLEVLLRRQIEHFSEEGRDPWLLAASDPAHPPELPADVSPAQAAAWTAVARVLLNLDETISKE